MSTTKQVLYFTAGWCGPCQQIKPYFYKLMDETPGVEFTMLDVDNEDCANLVQKYKVEGIPAFFFVKDGVVQGSLVGADKNKLIAGVQKLANL